MLTAFYRSQGPAADVLELGEMPDPQPGKGEVRVRLRASGINPSDVKSRAGAGGRAMAFAQIVPHSDGAGDIDAVGEGVDRARIGQRVWIWNGQWNRPFGTAAEFIVIPEVQAVPLDPATSFSAGACLGIPALTAYQAVSLTDIGPGSTVLVTGGAGSVGFYAVQFAKMRGARVIASISSDEKGTIALEAGADHIANYRQDNYAATLVSLTGGKGVDAIVELDLAANASLYEAILRPHGTVSIYGLTGNSAELNARWLLRSSINLHFMFVYTLSVEDRATAIEALSELLESQRVRHRIHAELPLEQITAAHELVESGTTLGNVVLRVA